VPVQLHEGVSPRTSPGRRIVVVSAGGRETLLPDALSGLPGEDVVAAVGAIPDHRLAAASVRAGADEYFALPGDYDALELWIRGRIAMAQQDQEGQAFTRGEADKYRFDGIIGQSEPLQHALRTAARVIPHGSATILITGETGTGKELVARAVHYNGPRREFPFVEINCAAIPENLLESELFGHEKGAFTHATSAKPGLFEVASGGTVFLDEVGHLPLALQGKLLRILENHTFRRLGSTRIQTADVRVIAATHVDLQEAVRLGTFREDLFYRLNILPIHLPPLRVRGFDAMLLARHFIARFAKEYGVTVPRLAPPAEARLVAAVWPGNVRELRNVLERAVVLCQDGVIHEADLGMARSQPAPVGLAQDDPPLTRSLDQIIANAVSEALATCGGNKSAAARRLRISRTRLQRIVAWSSDVPDCGVTSHRGPTL
jgi:DNA-binding NtrC family response regulator